MQLCCVYGAPDSPNETDLQRTYQRTSFCVCSVVDFQATQAHAEINPLIE